MPGICFSPLTGILGLETEYHESYKWQKCFSPLTGILGLETLQGLYHVAFLLFQSPYGDFGFRNGSI